MYARRLFTALSRRKWHFINITGWAHWQSGVSKIQACCLFKNFVLCPTWTCGHRGGNCKYPDVRFDKFMDVSLGCKLSRFSRPAPTATVTAVKLRSKVMSGEAGEGKQDVRLLNTPQFLSSSSHLQRKRHCYFNLCNGAYSASWHSLKLV